MREVRDLRRLFVDGAELELSSMFGIFEHWAKEHRHYKVSLVGFLSTEDPIELFQERHLPGYSFEFEGQKDFCLVDLSRTIRRSNIEGGERTVEGQFGICRNDESDMWIAFTSGSPDFFNLGLLSFLRDHRPEITRIYLSSEEIRGLFQRLEDERGWSVFVVKSVLYSHLEEGAIDFTKDHFLALFNEAENKNRYVDKVEFVVNNGSGKRLFHGFISRECVFYFRDGKITVLTQDFLPQVSDIARGKKRMFESKERKLGELAVNPIDVVFSEDRFSQEADNRRFAQALSKIGRVGLSVFHMNPYLHVALLDFTDGSRFDLVAVSSRRVRIIPAHKSSVHSLMRISDGIFKAFDEATLEAVEPARYSVDDFVGG